MGLLDARAGDRRRHIRTTFTALLAATLAFALLPATGAQAQAVDIRQELADRAHAAMAAVRSDAGLPALDRRADLEQPAIAWAAWLAPEMADGGQFRVNPDLGEQVCCAQDRPGEGASDGVAFSLTLTIQSGTTTADGARAALDRLIDRHIKASDGQIRRSVEDPDIRHSGVGVTTSGEYLILNVHLRQLDEEFGEPPTSWPRPRPLAVATACPDEPAPTFRDVQRDSVHAPAIGCVASRGITEGVRGGGYDPGGTVTRGQMASFLVRLLDDRGVQLPARPSSRPFSDTAGSVHEAAIERLNAAEIAKGGRDGRYRPNDPVSRDQMATFLVRTFGFAGGSTDLDPTKYDFFVDDWVAAGSTPGPGGVHGANVQRAAEIGVATGRERPVVGFYGMRDDVKRDQMASFLSRLSGAIAQL